MEKRGRWTGFQIDTEAYEDTGLISRSFGAENSVLQQRFKDFEIMPDKIIGHGDFTHLIKITGSRKYFLAKKY